MVHQALGLHAPHPAVISALQLLPKMNHFGGHVRYPVLKLMELTECFLKEKISSYMYVTILVAQDGVEKGQRIY